MMTLIFDKIINILYDKGYEMVYGGVGVNNISKQGIFTNNKKTFFIKLTEKNEISINDKNIFIHKDEDIKFLLKKLEKEFQF